MKRILTTLSQKWAEYLLEILVITFGILFAFALNNWNEDRKNQKLEAAFLSDINQEFKGNKSEFDKILKIRTSILEMCGKVESLRPLTIQNWECLKPMIQKLLRAPTFDPSQSSLESLINSSSIDIIKNNTLKKVLLSWSKIVADRKEEENYYMEINHTCYDWLRLNTDVATLNLINSDHLFVFQNLLQANCTYVNLLVNSNPSSGRNESEELANAIDSIISLTEPYAE